MWNRQQDDAPEAKVTDNPPVSSPAESQPPPPRKTAPQAAVLGPSITIQGTLAGDEDLLIEGRVDGEIAFKNHTVTVGKSGRIKADLHCKNIYVEGQVHGNLYGDDVVVVKTSAKVNGNAVAPRVSLEDGCHFHGSIDMQPKSQKSAERQRSRAEDRPRTSHKNQQSDQTADTQAVSANPGR